MPIFCVLLISTILIREGLSGMKEEEPFVSHGMVLSGERGCECESISKTISSEPMSKRI